MGKPITSRDRNRAKFAAKNRNRRHRRDVNRTPVSTHTPGDPAVFRAMAQAAAKAAAEQAEWEQRMALLEMATQRDFCPTCNGPCES